MGLTVSMLIASTAHAWDDFGHMEVAAVAFKKLNTKAKAKVSTLLRLNPHYSDWIVGAKKTEADRVAFMRAATWADSIKSDRTYKDDKQTDPTASQNIGYTDLSKHAYWHFVDQPFSPDGTPLIQPIAPNAATEIAILRAALSAAATSDDVKSYDLVWLLHLVGDVHQPLHCVSRYDAADPKGDRGGNNVNITGNAQPPVCDDPRYCPFGPPNELHAFYDDIEGSGYATAPVVTAAAFLPKTDAKMAAITDVAVWVTEGVDLAKNTVYVNPIGRGDGPFTVTPTYQAAAYKLGQERIALAGARLANLLNGSLDVAGHTSSSGTALPMSDRDPFVAEQPDAPDTKSDASKRADDSASRPEKSEPTDRAQRPLTTIASADPGPTTDPSRSGSPLLAHPVDGSRVHADESPEHGSGGAAPSPISHDIYRYSTTTYLSRVESPHTERTGILPNTRRFVPTAIFFAMLLVSVALSIVIPSPTVTQQVTFRMVLALAAAGVGAAVPGDLHIKGEIHGIQVEALGGLALFIVAYLMTPKVFASTSKKIARPRSIHS